MSWIDKIVKQESTEIGKIKAYLAFCMGTFCPDEDSLTNMANGILYIVGKKTLEEIKTELEPIV